jgi:hypothetical protein
MPNREISPEGGADGCRQALIGGRIGEDLDLVVDRR